MSAEIKKTDILNALVQDYNTHKSDTWAKQADVVPFEYNVAGCVHPLRPGMTAKGRVEPGTSVWDAVKEACKAAGVRESFMRRGVAQIGTRDLKNNVTVWRPISQSLWKTRKLGDGELLRFRLLPAGGGGSGGKNPLRTILTVIVAVAAVAVTAMVGGWALGVEALTKMTAAGLTLNSAGTALVALSGLAVSTIGMVLVNAIAPIKAPTLGGLGTSTRDESQVYGLSAGQNAINQWGRVPVPLGRGRFAPPKAASPYTINKGDDQYLHELLCIGIGDLEVSDIKIGTTAIEEFVDVEYEVFKYDPELENSSPLYPTGVFQEDLNIQLEYNVWNTRTTAECDKAECDISFQGLGYFNDSGGIDTRTVLFDVQYKLSDSVDWKDVYSPYQVAGKTFEVVDIPSSTSDGVIVFNESSGLQLLWGQDEAPQGSILLRKVRGTRVTETKTVYEGGRSQKYVTLSYDGVSLSFRDTGPQTSNIDGLSVSLVQPQFKYERVCRVVAHEGSTCNVYDRSTPGKIQVSSGTYTPETAEGSGSAVVSYNGRQSTLMRRTFTITFPQRGVYDVRWRRKTGDSTNDRERTDSYWTALRSVSNDRPVQTEYPVNLLAIKAKATGQLSGSLGNVTIYYRSQSLDWDKETGTWVKRFTSNPASIFRHVLQDKIALARPQSDNVIDLDNFAAAHEYWAERGWEWNFVCDASVSVFERLQSICAAGLSSPTMADGKWSIIIDKPRDYVACAFTSANSWSWSFERTQVRLPNEIHCTFISGATWDTEMRRVATDEPIGAELLYETQAYEGVNDPAQIYQLARFHYADAKNRRRTISLRCYDEALLCTRGDLVECACPNVSPRGLQVGRVRKVITDENGYVTGFTTDQSNTTDFSGRRFGVRVYNSEGIIYHAEVKPENTTQTVLNFISPQQMDIANGDKYAFGDYSEEVFQAIVIGMQFNTDWTCDVTLQDYVPSLYGDLSQPIPDFELTITRPIETKWRLTSTPIIKDVATDESVLLKNGATLNPRILVVVAHPTNLDERVQSMELDYKKSETESWVNVRKGIPLEDMDIFIDGVEEGSLYDIRIRYTNQIGFAGDYAFSENVKVIGKTSLPPNVQGFTATIESPSGVRLAWEALDVLDIASYRITGDAQTEVVGNSTIAQVPRKTGTLSFDIVAIDTGGRVSESSANATVEVVAPGTPDEVETETRTDGLYLTWDDCDTTWPIRHYNITDEYLGRTSKEMKTQFVVSPRSAGSYAIDVQAVDIFDNFGAQKAFAFVVQQPSTPVVTTEVNNGVVRLKWPAVESSFPVKTYQVFSIDGQLLQETSATFFDVDGPAGTLEYRVRAVDSAGNMSAFGEIALELTAPDAPVVSVNLNKNRDGLDLTWTVPDSMLPVLTYDIVRQWTENGETKEQDYGSTDATALSVPAITSGQHTFLVRAVDQSGNRSTWGTTDILVRAPGAAFLTDVNVIDNNVQVYWQEPTDLFFAIAYYNFGTLEDGYFSLIGRIDARFASRFEREAGEYTYQICPVDVAGNVGQCSNITAQVAQPPDFIFFDDKDSTLNGELVNAALDGRGNMILPVYPNETWQENINRVAGLLAADPASLTWQQKIDSDYPAWQSPPAASATYKEIVDAGTDVPSTSITVTVTSRTLEGNPQISCKIEVSSDMIDWRVMTEGSFQTYASSFRYVRYTFTVTGGMAAISAINYRLDVKKQTDFGSVFSAADDNGDGFISADETPELYGTYVPFIVSFTDVQSGPMAFCNEEGKTAYVNFQDVLNPNGFRVYVLDKEGQRTSGQVSWMANGV